MAVDSLIEQYNYDAFIPTKFEPWMRFDQSPPLGEPASNFALWRLEESETSLKEIWTANDFTIVEFGSFT